MVAVADYVLVNTPGNTVSNLSSTRALKDVTESYGGRYYSSAVGEVNVVELAAKYFPIIFGIPKEEVYKIPISTLTLLFKKYVETYTNMIKSQSFLDIMGKR